MFYKHKYEDRLASWSDFRKTLETCENPIQEAINYYDNAPQVSINTDPWDQNTWPTPWQLVAENQYCNFCKLLGVCYSLQLTERFSGSNFEIHIVIDNKNSTYNYLLYVDKTLIGYPIGVEHYAKSKPDELEIKKKYSMPKLQ